jgi:hypothetical protein
MSNYTIVGNKTTDSVFPNLRPTLNLDFTNTKSLDPRISFTRSSGGSYVGQDGFIKYAGINEPRFDHDPITGECLGLLVEETRTNLLPNSTVSSGDSNTTVVVDQSILSPDNTNSTQKVNVNLLSGTGGSSSDVILNSTGEAQNYCWSVFIKRGSFPDASIELRIGTTEIGFINKGRVDYNFDTDVVTLFNDTIGGGRILYSDGWVRLFGVANVPAGNFFRLNNTIRNVQLKRGPSSFIYQWGSQIELGSFCTSYIPTIGIIRSRSGDIVSIPEFEFNNSGGTLYCEAIGAELIETALSGTYWQISGNMSQNYILLSYDTLNSINFSIFSGGELMSFSSLANQLPSKKFIKNISSFKDNYFSSYSGGIPHLQVVNENNILPVFDNITIGHTNELTSYLNGTMRRLTYWPSYLSENQLRVLTK